MRHAQKPGSPALCSNLDRQRGLFGYAPIAAQQPNEYDRTLARVLRLLPRPPDTIVVVDADTSGRSLHRSLQHVEGFVIHGERVVRLVRQGETLQRAMKGGGIFDYALAIIVWHEMAHIDGADEAAARRADEQLWAEFVRASASTASAVSNI